MKSMNSESFMYFQIGFFSSFYILPWTWNILTSNFLKIRLILLLFTFEWWKDSYTNGSLSILEKKLNILFILKCLVTRMSTFLSHILDNLIRQELVHYWIQLKPVQGALTVLAQPKSSGLGTCWLSLALNISWTSFFIHWWHIFFDQNILIIY